MVHCLDSGEFVQSRQIAGDVLRAGAPDHGSFSEHRSASRRVRFEEDVDFLARQAAGSNPRLAAFIEEQSRGKVAEAARVLERTQGALRRFGPSERGPYLDRFLVDFLVLRRDLKLAYRTYEAMDRIRLLEDGNYLVAGAVSLRNLNRNMDWRLPENEASTLNGLLLEELGEIPSGKASLKIGTHIMTILEIKENVIGKVLVKPNWVPK